MDNQTEILEKFNCEFKPGSVFIKGIDGCFLVEGKDFHEALKAIRKSFPICNIEEYPGEHPIYHIYIGSGLDG